MSRKPTDKEKKDIRNIGIAATGASAVGAASTYGIAARNKQKEAAAGKMLSQYKSRLQEKHNRTSFKPPINPNTKKPYGARSSQYRNAQAEFNRKKLKADGKTKDISQVPALKKKYSKYAQRVAKLTGTKWEDMPRSRINDALEKVKDGSRGREFKAKGLVSLLGLWKGRASLRNTNLIGKLGKKSQDYTSKSRGGKKYVGGLDYEGQKLKIK